MHQGVASAAHIALFDCSVHFFLVACLISLLYRSCRSTAGLIHMLLDLEACGLNSSNDALQS